MNKYSIIQEHNKFGLYNDENKSVIIPTILDLIILIDECYFLKFKEKWAVVSKFQLEIMLYTLNFQNEPIYLFIDIESTGINITSARLIQLGFILCDGNGNDIISDNIYIKPKQFEIPESATKINGITTEFAIANGIDLTNALHRLISAMNVSTYLVGHNVSFDIDIIYKELIRTNINYNIQSKPKIDTMFKSIDYCAIPSGYSYGDKYKWPKLQELHKKLFGYEFDNAHDAMADIRATKKCFFEMKRLGLINE